ncbi:MAG: DUF983 domain-containing protein [Phototrophicaceae bacterium]
MRSRKPTYVLRKLWVGARLRCPECERGRLFNRSFRMESTCAYCHSRFDRASGDAVGGVYINVALAELSALAGIFLVHDLTGIPLMHQLLFWVPYVLLFTVVMYRHTRGLWLGVVYLTGGIYPDADYEREYIRTAQPLYSLRHPHQENDHR